MSTAKNNMIPIEKISGKILLIRGQKVLMDRALAELYGVETKTLKRAVRRNLERFPSDFMFEMNNEEFKNWRYQFGTSNSDKNLALKVEKLERQMEKQGKSLQQVMQIVSQLLEQPKPKPFKIGFRVNED